MRVVISVHCKRTTPVKVAIHARLMARRSAVRGGLECRFLLGNPLLLRASFLTHFEPRSMCARAPAYGVGKQKQEQRAQGALLQQPEFLSHLARLRCGRGLRAPTPW